MPQFLHQLALAMAESIERLATTILAACLLGGYVAPQELFLTHKATVAGVIAIGVLVTAIVMKVILKHIEATEEAGQ